MNLIIKYLSILLVPHQEVSKYNNMSLRLIYLSEIQASFI